DRNVTGVQTCALPISRKIVSQMAEDATRNGFRVMIPDNPNLQERIQIKLDNLRLQKELTQQVRYYFGHGDGYLTIGIKELHPTRSEERRVGKERRTWR